MDISKLPKAGTNFRAKNSVSSFETKLSSATKFGAKNLASHKDIITDVVASYLKPIKEGGLSSSQQRNVKIKIKKVIARKGGNISIKTDRDITKIIKGLGKNGNNPKNTETKKGSVGVAKKKEKPKVKSYLIQRASDVEDDNTQPKAGFGSINRRSTPALRSNKVSTGFASNLNNADKSIPSSSSSSLGGTKPIGFN